MKGRLITLAIAGIILSCSNPSSNQSSNPKAAIPATGGYDSLLAASVGADEYGMRTYVMALLKEGPNRNQDSLEAAAIQRDHMANIKRMAADGQLIIAGPFLDSWEVKGIYIFAVETVAEAERLTNSDPAVQAGRLEMELHLWYGSAALMKSNELHARITKVQF